MKTRFRGYFRPSEEEFESLWDKCLFSFDTNILLDLYRIEEFKRTFFEILDKIPDRIWLPNQVVSEFLKRRIDLIGETNSRIGELKKCLESGMSNFAKVANCFAELAESHNEIEEEINISGGIETLKDSIERELEKVGEMEFANDPILDELSIRFDNKVGDPYPSEKLTALQEDAETRCSERIPPGYADYDQATDNSFGDVLIWLQLIDKAVETGTPIIFITRDKKEDWWLKYRSTTVGPRPELIQEMHEKAGVDFYLYGPKSFLEHAGKKYMIEVSKETVEEVEKTEEMTTTWTTPGYSGVTVREYEKALDILRRVGAEQASILKSYQIKPLADLAAAENQLHRAGNTLAGLSGAGNVLAGLSGAGSFMTGIAAVQNQLDQLSVAQETVAIQARLEEAMLKARKAIIELHVAEQHTMESDEQDNQ